MEYTKGTVSYAPVTSSAEVTGTFVLSGIGVVKQGFSSKT